MRRLLQLYDRSSLDKRLFRVQAAAVGPYNVPFMPLLLNNSSIHKLKGDTYIINQTLALLRSLPCVKRFIRI